ncbi:testis-expressed protein 36 [Vombatus ursinus]|uniref:Domain of unknown function with conserved HDNR motif domain-containing protein n=1 Tax=Vombatus ursinus TaxID=29139 RepID=A0A4X2ME42_VOMUR|nr:testis-expressed protein 36 [Vombatus ursinus]
MEPTQPSSAVKSSPTSWGTSGSPASAATPAVSPASAATPAAQAPPTLPSSSLLYSQVSRIIASRTQRAGIWFPHLSRIEKTPESTTTTMLKQPFLPESKRKMEEGLPSRYQLRQQQANKNNFPFSVHDNRRDLEFCGHGLDESLGRKKLEQVQMHFHSANFNHRTSDYIPTPEDNTSTYQASYTAKSRARGLFFPLFPKHHRDRWNTHFI